MVAGHLPRPARGDPSPSSAAARRPSSARPSSIGLMAQLRDSLRYPPRRRDRDRDRPARPHARTMAEALGEAGFTRASLGVQSLDPEVQAAISRRQSLAETATRDRPAARGAGIGGINLDLIYGLPHQTVASCLDTVRGLPGAPPRPLLGLRLCPCPGLQAPPAQDRRRPPSPAAPARNAQADAIAAELEAGRLPPDRPRPLRPPRRRHGRRRPDAGNLHRNFQGYTTDGADLLIGLGASAIGRLPQGYVQNAPSPATISRRRPGRPPRHGARLCARAPTTACGPS